MKKILLMLMVVVLVASLGACAQPGGGGAAGAPAAPGTPATAADGQDTIILTFGHVLAPEHPYHLGALRFKEILEATSPVPVEVQIFHSAQLGSERDMTEGLQLGTLDMVIAPGTIVLFEPRMGVLYLPHIFDDEAHAHRVLDGEIGDYLAQTLPDNGLRLLAYWENGFRNVTNNLRPVYTPDDIIGMRLRVPENPIYQAIFEHFGASVATIPFAEVYAALQQGVVDAQENPLAIILTSRFYEVQNYLSLTAHVYGPAQVLISEARWQSFTPELQDAIKAAAIEARTYQRQALATMRDEALIYLADHITINEINREAFSAAGAEIWELYREDFGDLIDRIRAYA